jgi:cytochrome c oxidase accessory protein FixG
LKNNIYELDPERLATTDESGNRVYLYPEDVKGVWKNRRQNLYWTLILIYLVLPWFYIKGKPFLLVDIVNREFTFFGATLHGVEPILFFLIATSGLFMIAALTSSLGRVWCGWACPQTVFIQSIFMKIESLIEGKARVRREMDAAGLTPKKAFKKILKWTIFALISLHIAHTFMGYFVGPRELLKISMHSPDLHPVLFSLTMIGSLIILLDFGWFREQFCIIACPYGRIQSVMMDDNSLVVAYDVKRGEPRRQKDNAAGTPEGDCINCYNCVKVCPTGIDIRRGTQLECIACTQCIDACDEIMTKMKRPKGLIRYSSENELLGKKKIAYPTRSKIYTAISLILVSLFIFSLKNTTHLHLIFLRSKTPFQVVETGKLIINQFTLKIHHQGSSQYRVRFQVEDVDLKDKVTIVTPVHPFVIDLPDEKTIIFFKFSPDLLRAGTRKILVEVFDELSGMVISHKEVTLVGPID